MIPFTRNHNRTQVPSSFSLSFYIFPRVFNAPTPSPLSVDAALVLSIHLFPPHPLFCFIEGKGVSLWLTTTCLFMLLSCSIFSLLGWFMGLGEPAGFAVRVPRVRVWCRISQPAATPYPPRVTHGSWPPIPTLVVAVPAKSGTKSGLYFLKGEPRTMKKVNHPYT